MKQVSIFPESIPEELRAGLDEIASREGFPVSPGDIRIVAQPGDRFEARREGRVLNVHYQKPVQFFRALSLLKDSGGREFAVCRQPLFQHNGAMLDCSRNAVLKPETLRLILRKMALMGLDTAMLYTEDTYELPGRPYFGYLRGRYTQQELRELDRYAADLGIELIPCIQTLGHLERALHWPQTDPDLRDTPDILMVGEEKVYALIDKMLRFASETFRTRNIHIGMDEAWTLGLGNYRFRHGYTPAEQLMKEHLRRVHEIARKYSLKPMMWSDMYFRTVSRSGSYYDVPDEIPPNVLDAADPDIPLVYWDYYHEDPAFYDRFIRMHTAFRSPLRFAGGLWTWVGPAPATDKMLRVALPALQKCAEHSIPAVFATAWGDDGAEASLLTALYGLQVFAEFDYSGGDPAGTLAARFEACTGEPADAFAHLCEFNRLPGTVPKTDDPVNAAKFLLYEDPLIPLFDADLGGTDFSAHYQSLQQEYAAYHSGEPSLEAMYRFYESLAGLLAERCRWRTLACAAGKRSPEAAQAALLAERMAALFRVLKARWQTLWELTCKPFGFEVIDLRLSGAAGRFETAAAQMRRLADGEIDRIETLSCPKLPNLTDGSGRFSGCCAWSQCISACRI